MKYAQEQNMIHFLMGLNDSYTSVRGSLLMMSPLPSLGQTYSLLTQEERQRQVKSAGQFLSDTASSFNAGTQRSVHQSQYPQKRFDGRKPSPYFCDHCKKQVHTINKCYKLHGYPNKQQNRPKGGKYANNSWNEVESQSESPKQTAGSNTNVSLPGLDVEQSK